MTEVILFKNHQIRKTFVEGDEIPHFVARDFYETAFPNFKSAQLGKRLMSVPATYKGITICNTLGGPQSMATISFLGAMYVLARANEESTMALEMQDWLFNNHLRNYIINGEQNANLQQQITQVKQELEETKQISNALEELYDSRELMAMDEVVKELRECFCDLEHKHLVGRTSFMAFLYDTEVLRKKNKYPYQEYAHWFKVVGGSPKLYRQYLPNMKLFVKNRIPKKASILQLAHVNRAFIMHTAPQNGA